MRIALLSTVKRTSQGQLRCLQELAGRSVLAWQIDLALELGCERIICLSNASFDELLAEQRRVEDDGLTFHSVRTHLQLADLVRPDDSLFVQLDGLLVSGDGAQRVRDIEASSKHAVLAISHSHALASRFPDDFERIDRERHWAGIAILPGECAAELKNMPGDSDAVSLLLRLGLQARVPCEEVAAENLDHDQWLLACDEEALDRRASAFMNASLPKPEWAGPGVALATSIVRLSPSNWLGLGAETSALFAIVSALIGMGLAIYGMAAAGLALASLAAFGAGVCRASVALRKSLSSFSNIPTSLRFLEPILWILCVAMVVLAHTQAEHWPVQFAIPILAFGLARLAGRNVNSSFGAFWRDTPLLLAVLAGAAAFNLLQEVLLIIALGALAQLMLHARPQKAKAQN
ncbi:MAG: hypothetical protein AAFY42_01270 [Pseudomonadota bacterium]